MGTRKRITTPGVSDNQWASILCTPTTTTVDFHELEDQAVEAANANLAPSTSVYVAQVKHQGEHGKKGTAHHYAVVVELTPGDLAAIRCYNGARSREAVQDTLHMLLEASLAGLAVASRWPTDRVEEVPRDDDEQTVSRPLDAALLARAGKKL